MQSLGDGSKRSGKYTGLSIAQEFANAVCHFLRDHPLARPHEDGGKELPLDQEIWEATLKLEYDTEALKDAQSLAAYCRYYNNAAHGHGYDLDGGFDCGTGNRNKSKQNKGKSVSEVNRHLAVHPGTRRPYLSPTEIIEIITQWFPEIPTENARRAAARVNVEKDRRSGKEPVWLAADQADQTQLQPFVLQDRDSRLVVERQIRERRGQQKFRDELRKRYGDACLVTGCKVLHLLEATHIKEYRGESDNHVDNGLLLRADIHTLFDLDLLGVEPTKLTIELHPALFGDKNYAIMAGRNLRCKGRNRPSIEALKQRYERFVCRKREYHQRGQKR